LPNIYYLKSVKSVKSYEPEPVNYIVRHQKEISSFITFFLKPVGSNSIFSLAPLRPNAEGYRGVRGQKCGGTQNRLTTQTPIRARLKTRHIKLNPAESSHSLRRDLRQGEPALHLDRDPLDFPPA
jgi:hypothetical protein